VASAPIRKAGRGEEEEQVGEGWRFLFVEELGS
jgi:hypothetical protein